jgi:uracil-DNA glycosylase family 4
MNTSGAARLSSHVAVPPRDVSDYNPVKHGARCDICPLKGEPYVPFVEPPGKPRLILVGEGPGMKETFRRVPFVGVSGRLLDDTLEDVGVERNDCYVTNAALCRGESDKDNDRAAECCAPRLLKELATLPKDVPIVAIGKAAARSILGVKSILLARGFVWTTRPLDSSIKSAEGAVRKARREAGLDTSSVSPERRPGKSRNPISHAAAGARAKLRTGARLAKARQAVIDAELRLQTVKLRHELAFRTVCPTVHPAFVLRSDAWTPIMKLDLDRAARVVVTPKGVRIRRGDKLDPLDDQIVRVTRVEDLSPRTYFVTDNADEIRTAAAKLGSTVACDIETTSDKPLSPLTVRQLCACISDGERTVVVGPFDPRLHSAVMTEVLAHREAIVFHNGYNFDQIAQERDGIKLPLERVEDTLIAHHTFGSQYPQKLDHVVSVFCDSSPWKIKHGRRGGEEKGQAPEDLPPDELYHYNACDGVLTAKSWRGMQADLDDEREVYEHDKALSLQGKRMQVIGIRVDTRRKRLLSVLLHRRAAALKGRLRKLARDPEFQPTKLGDVRRVLFGTLRAPMLNPTASGLASTSNATLEALRTGGIAGSDETRATRAAKFAEALLRWRVTVKVKSTYVDAVSVQSDKRVHYNWRPYGTVSGRYSSRIQSCPRWSRAVEERVREMYVASPGHTLVYFDLKQAEAKGAAILSGDPVFIAACAKDIHAENAKILFPAKRELLERDAKGKHCPKHGEHGSEAAACNCGKMYRDIAKNFMYGVNYGAEAKTLLTFIRSQGFSITLDAVDEALTLLKVAYKVYFQYAAENIAYVEKHGYLRSAIVGRKMWLGFHPKPNDVYNRPVQSVVADAMNIRTPIIEARAPAGVHMVMQGHDAAMFDTPNRHVETMERLILETWEEPFHLKESCVVRSPRDLVFGADVKSGHRWSEL